MKYYLRIGNIPTDEKSKIYQWNEEHTSLTAIGEEKGVSVYNATLDEDIWKILPPDNQNKSYKDTLKELTRLVEDGIKKLFLVTGEEIGIGYDGEPLLKNVILVKDVSYMWR